LSPNFGRYGRKARKEEERAGAFSFCRIRGFAVRKDSPERAAISSRARP
tara:strand:- start:1125 stop:1271 length:147 start_codon:yes stop_codon:yes gene_type:complete